MTSERPDEASIFNAARKIESADERSAYLNDACGNDAGLRERIDKLLAAFVEQSQFLEQPAPGLAKTVVPTSPGNFAASLDAGLAATFGEESAVVVGNTNHSVLKSMSASLSEVPRVSLREPKEERDEPIQRPSSPEIPKQPSDSRYRLDGEIARGGMGAVLRGRDTDLGRDLAVKVLLDAHKDKPEVVQRFIEEAQIGGQLQHPGIAPVYELGQFADQRPFFSMKLVKGDTLSKLLSDRDDPTTDRSKLIGIFEQVCQTMAYAHSRGVIHRDLKPANIMVGAFGEVQVMDWGLAKVLSAGGVADEKTARKKQQGETLIQTMRSVGSDAIGSVGSAGSETQMGSVMGTPAYMPPEQALGEIDMLDQRADVFGLGAILAEILTGQPPYVADDGTQIYRMASRGKLGDCFTRLDECGADGELISLAKQCLELEPADRPKDANALAEQVTGYLESVETKLRTAEVQRARFRITLGLGAAALAILIAGIVATAWQAREAKRQTRVAESARNEATQQRDNARDAEQDALKAKAAAVEAKLREEALAKQRRRELYASDMQLADQLYNGQNGEQLRIQQILASWIPVDDQEDLREFSWRYQWTRLHNGGSFSVPDCKGVAITPAGKMVVADSEGLHELDESGNRNKLIGWTLKHPWAWFSTDGRWVASKFETGVELYHIESGKKVLSLPQTKGSFSVNGNYFAAWNGNAEVDSLGEDEDAIPVWKLDGKSAAPIAPLVIGDMVRLPKFTYDLKLGSDGKSFLLGGRFEAFLNGNPESVRITHSARASCAWSPDGRIITSTEFGTVEFRLSSDVAQKRTLEKLSVSTHGKGIATVRFSPNGNMLATGGTDGTIDLWDVSELVTATKRLETSDPESTDEQNSSAFSIAALPRPRLIRTIKAFTNGISNLDTALSFSPDNSFLAARDYSGNVKRWDLKNVPGKYQMDRITDDLYGWTIPWYAKTSDGEFSIYIKKIDANEIVKGNPAANERIVGIFDPEKGDWLIREGTETWHDFGILLQGSRGSEIRLRLENAEGEQHEVTLLRQYQRLDQSPRSFSVAFDPGGNNVIVGDYTIGATRLNLETREAIRYPNRGMSAAYSPDGRLVAIAGPAAISIRDLETDKELHQLDSLIDADWNGDTFGGHLAFSPDGKYLAHVSSYRYNTTKSDLNVWRTSDFKKVGGGPLHQEENSMTAPLFSPDSSRLLIGGRLGYVRIWETSDWSQQEPLTTGEPGTSSMAISSDGKRLVTGHYFPTGGVNVWNLETGQRMRKLSCPKVGWLSLSPDDRTLAVGGFDHNVVLWDMETGTRLQTIQAHSERVNGVEFSKDGARLATLSHDGVLRLWDAASNEEIETDASTLLAMSRLAVLRAEQERHKEAGALYSKVIELNLKTQHLTEGQLTEIKDNQVKALRFYAISLERLGRWDKALECWTELVRLDPDEHFYQYRVASAHLFLEDEESFWQVWQTMFDRWGDDESQIAKRVSKLRLLINAPDRELRTALKVVDWAFDMRDETSVVFVNFVILSKGMAEYRRGSFVDALKHLDEARIGFEKDARFTGNGSMCQYFACMAHHRLGDSDAAKAAFLDARDRQHQWASDLKKSMAAYFFLDWQQTEVVRREAAELLGIDESQLDPPVSATAD